jgi:ubiquinone/menaquinone biosynthesis C-methylase UbiE
MTRAGAGRHASPTESDRQAERKHFDSRYKYEGPIDPDTEETFRPVVTPMHERGGTPGGLVQARAWEILASLGLEGKCLLDYACGAGHWGIRLAQIGATVKGFDLSPVGVERANARASVSGVGDRASFVEADAGCLPYRDETFDLVAGIQALHHTIKYPGSADELRRVVKRGGVCVFTENIDGNVFLRVARRWTMRNEAAAGDVILTEHMIRKWASQFSSVEIEQYGLFTMAKRLRAPRYLLAVLHRVDLITFRLLPFSRRWCGECVLIIRR